ncbi:MAG: PAS domain-containing protein, partial [Candidatus Shapirobacteria bacterium]
YQAIDQSSNEVFIFRADTLRFTYANQGALRNLGYTIEALLQMTPLDLKKTMPEKEFRSILEQLLSGEKTDVTFISKHWRSDGSTYPVETRLHLHDSGKVKVFLAIVTDMTENQKAMNEATARIEELKRWHDITLNREGRIIGLKVEVNELCKKLGQARRYDGEYLDDGL